MAKRNAQPNESRPLENLDAALSDITSNAHPDGDTLEKPVDPANALVESKAKKPRTVSPVQLASRAFQRLCDLQAQQAREATRHAERVIEIGTSIKSLEAEVDAMAPEVRKLFEGLRAAAEAGS